MPILTNWGKTMKLTSEQRDILIEQADALWIDGVLYHILETDREYRAVYVKEDHSTFETFFWYGDIEMDELVYE